VAVYDVLGDGPGEQHNMKSPFKKEETRILNMTVSVALLGSGWDVLSRKGVGASKEAAG
jgi:hypothetical protein